MKVGLIRRLEKLEAQCSAGIHFIDAYTEEELDQRVAEMIASGKARQGDKFIHWQRVFVEPGPDHPVNRKPAAEMTLEELKAERARLKEIANAQ